MDWLLMVTNTIESTTAKKNIQIVEELILLMAQKPFGVMLKEG